MQLAVSGEYRIYVLSDQSAIDITECVSDLPHVEKRDLIISLIQNFDHCKERISALIAKGDQVPLAGLRLSAPIERPRNIVCMAVNYLEDGTLSEPKPINAFHKVSSAVIGTGKVMVLPDAPATNFECEAEVAVVIGKQARNVKAADAMEHVFGYMNFIDGSARGLPPPANVFFQGKSRDTFAPMGPFIVTADEIADPQNIGVRLWVNGTLKQSFNTSDMAHNIARCIEWVSSIQTLEAGDILATGTNHGGLSSVQHDDVIEMECDQLGRLQFSIRDDLGRTWPRETRLERQAQGLTPLSSQISGKYSVSGAET